jgi:hypothetical protein
MEHTAVNGTLVEVDKNCAKKQVPVLFYVLVVSKNSRSAADQTTRAFGWDRLTQSPHATHVWTFLVGQGGPAKALEKPNSFCR